MATYDLDRQQIISLLQNEVSQQTQRDIVRALEKAGFLSNDNDNRGHIRGDDRRDDRGDARDRDEGRGVADRAGGRDDDHASVKTMIDNTSGSSTLSAAAGTQFFLEEGPNASISLKHSSPMVIATGDGKVSLTDNGQGGDTLIGGAGAEMLSVLRGANLLIAGGGANTLTGGAGRDTLVGGGHSSLVGGSGDDLLIGGLKHGAMDTLRGGSGFDTLKVSWGDDYIFAGSGKTFIDIGKAHATVQGGAGFDTVKVAGGSMLFQGGAGHDTISIGAVGNDSIYGGAHTTVDLSHSLKDAKVTSIGGGVTEIDFRGGQIIDVKNATLVFSDHTILKT